MSQISRLSQPDGSEDARFRMCLQNAFGGVLLSEFIWWCTNWRCTFISLHFYGPARHAIVVRDLNTVREQLANLEDCPDDLYLIEGDPNAFDDSVLSAQELEMGVVVQYQIVNCVIQNSRKFHYLAVQHVKNI